MIWTHMAAAALAGALAFGGAWRVQDWRFGAKEKERLEQEAELRRMNAKRVDTAAVNHENFKERERIVYRLKSADLRSKFGFIELLAVIRRLTNQGETT